MAKIGEGSRTTLIIERGTSGLYFASSPELPGLLAVGDSLEECVGEIPKSIKALRDAREAMGLAQRIKVHPVTEPT